MIEKNKAIEKILEYVDEPFYHAVKDVLGNKMSEGEWVLFATYGIDLSELFIGSSMYMETLVFNWSVKLDSVVNAKFAMIFNDPQSTLIPTYSLINNTHDMWDKVRRFLLSNPRSLVDVIEGV